MAISLNSVRPAEGSTHKKKRVGRGPGSGLGKTAGRGKRTEVRSGYSRKIGFEGARCLFTAGFQSVVLPTSFKKRWLEVSIAGFGTAFRC